MLLHVSLICRTADWTKTIGIVPRFGESAIQGVLGFSEDTPKDDPTHFWFLGTGRTLAAAAIMRFSKQMSQKRRQDDRLDEAFSLLVKHLQKANLPKPSIVRFSSEPKQQYENTFLGHICTSDTFDLCAKTFAILPLRCISQIFQVLRILFLRLLRISLSFIHRIEYFAQLCAI